jgi:hypothetical protein
MEDFYDAARESKEVQNILENKVKIICQTDLSTKADMVLNLISEVETRRYAMEIGGAMMETMQNEIDCKDTTIDELTKVIGVVNPKTKMLILEKHEIIKSRPVNQTRSKLLDRWNYEVNKNNQICNK